MWQINHTAASYQGLFAHTPSTWYFCLSIVQMSMTAIICVPCPQAKAALARRLAQRVLRHWGGAVEARCAAAHLAMRDHEICTLNKEARIEPLTTNRTVAWQCHRDGNKLQVSVHVFHAKLLSCCSHLMHPVWACLQIRNWEAGAVHSMAQRRLRRRLHAWADWQIADKHKLRAAQLAARRWQQTVCRSAFSTWWEPRSNPTQRVLFPTPTQCWQGFYLI
jgi:hypothetical protein